MNGRLSLPHESKFIADPNMRELNETLMRQQERVNSTFDAVQLASARRLAPQVAVTSTGFLARPGMFLPVSQATTVLLARPTPNDAGQPLAVYNSSGSIVVLEPTGTTINGKALGWIDEGLHILYPDASGWFGGFSASVDFVSAGALFGSTTGEISGSLADSGRQDVSIVMVVSAQAIATGAPACRGAGVGGSPTAKLIPLDATALTTVGAAIGFLPRGMLPALGQNFTVSVSDIANDQVAAALWVTNGGESSISVVTTGTGTSITSGSVTTLRPGALVIDAMANDDETDTGTPGTGQTEIVDGSAGGATVSLQASYKSMPRPGTTTMSWSSLTNAANKAHIAIVIEPARAA